MNVELTSMLWGGLSGAAMFALGLYWLWDMKPSNAETEWLRSEVKDLRRDLNEECAKRQRVEDRVHCIEHPPFEPKFGDWVKAACPDRSGLSPAVYLYKYVRDGKPLYRCIMKNDKGGTHEFDTYMVEPLDD